MLLTVSKRLEFSASRRLHVSDWSDAENLSAFGPETNAHYGSGRNYVAYFVFTGPVDPTRGMLINISEIKERAGKIVRERFDHKFLNGTTLFSAMFRRLPRTLPGNFTSMWLRCSPTPRQDCALVI
jgi:6-pyruvoyl-tetrahydropterin synthase